MICSNIMRVKVKFPMIGKQIEREYKRKKVNKQQPKTIIIIPFLTVLILFMKKDSREN
jgi:hypothetical protein